MSLKDFFFAKDDDDCWLKLQNSKTFDNLDLTLYGDKDKKTIFCYIVFVWGLTALKLIMLMSDVYTCIKLLVFNTWSNEYIQPYVPFKISKWLFSVCIMISILLLFWDIVYGYQIYKKNIISLSYINVWSRNINCLKQYELYCLFDKITPSGFKQKLIFLAFFELKNCSRLLFADTPRQVINGLTLWSVLLIKNNTNHKNLKDFDSLTGIFKKFNWIFKNCYEEAVLLVFMLLSFLIWLIFILKFLVGLIAYFQIYYKLVNKHHFSSLKEYVCITICYNIDYLTEKYQFKKFYSQVSLLDNDLDMDIDDPLGSIYSEVFDNSYYIDDTSRRKITSMLLEVDHKRDAELSRIIFSKTPDTLNTVPSYYYDPSSKKG